jgi:hypothetical protein
MAVRVGRDKESLWPSMMTGRKLARSWRGVGAECVSGELKKSPGRHPFTA